MPGKDEIGTQVTISGEREYLDKLEAISNAQKVLSSETAKTTAAYDKNDKSIEALTARSDGLNKKLDLQKQKVTVCKDALEAAKKEFGENSAQVQKWQKELNYAEAAVTKTEKAVRQNSEAMKRFSADLKTAGSRLDSMGNKLTVGLTVPLVAAGAASVNYASDTQEAINKVEVAFGEAAESVKNWSDTTLTAYGLAKGTALDMAALFGDMATSMGYGHAQAAEMSKSLVGLAADLASFKNISIDVASTALKSVFTGETESLKNLGVVMTQTNLQAYALAKGYETAYTKMDQAQQVAVRYQYVLEQTANAQGDFARTSDGTANQLRIFQESLKEAAAVAGDELLPIITPIIARLSELIQSFGDLDEGTRKAVVQAGLFLATLGPMLKLSGGVAQAISAGVTVYQSLKTALTAATAAQTGLNMAMNANPVGAIVTAIGTLVAVLGSLAVSTALVTDKTEPLATTLERSRKAREENTAAIRAEVSETTATAAAIIKLSEAENKTAAQKETLLALIKQLNEAVPDLSLAYDEQTDKLNMEADALNRVVEAEAKRQLQADAVEQLVALEKEHVLATNALGDAQERLTTAKANYDRMIAEGNYWDDITTEYVEAKREVERLNKELDINKSQAAELRETYGDLSESIEKNTEKVIENQRAHSDLAAVVEKAKGGYELLAKAQSEANDSGSISLDTLSSLISKYPELEKYLVETADGYALTEGALNDYLAAQRTEYELAVNQAASAAASIVDAETLKQEGIDATTLSIREQIAAMVQLYSMKAGEARALALDKYGNDVIGRKLASQEPDVTLYNNLMWQAQNALSNLDAAEKDLASYDRVSSMLGRSIGGGSKKSGGAKGATKEDPYAEARDALDTFLEDADHKIYLWSKQGGHEGEILAEYREMQDKVHTLAEQYRAQGLGEDSEQIQQLQKLWWGYEGSIASLQEEAADKAAAAKQDAYSGELADLKYFRDMGLISERDYYDGLARLRDEYLEEGSETWRSVTVELKNYLEQCRTQALEDAKKSYEADLDALEELHKERLEAVEDALNNEKEAIEEGYKAQQAAAKEAYEQKKATINAELELEKERMNAIIDGIDAEIRARKELREDEDQDDAIAKARKRLEAAQAQREYARTDEDKSEWDKEIVRLQEALDEVVQDKNDTAFYREKELEKEAVENQISSAKDAADAAQEQAKSDYENTLAQLASDYEAALELAQAAYEHRLERALRQYNDEAFRLEDNYRASTDSYLDYGSLTRQAEELARIVSAVSSAAAAQQVQNISHKTNSASVTIQQAPALTEGMIQRAVQKVIETLDK